MVNQGLIRAGGGSNTSPLSTDSTLYMKVLGKSKAANNPHINTSTLTNTNQHLLVR